MLRSVSRPRFPSWIKVTRSARRRHRTWRSVVRFRRPVISLFACDKTADNTLAQVRRRSWRSELPEFGLSHPFHFTDQRYLGTTTSSGSEARPVFHVAFPSEEKDYLCIIWFILHWSDIIFMLVTFIAIMPCFIILPPDILSDFMPPFIMEPFSIMPVTLTLWPT